jgi:hypothetical protein
MKKLKTFENFSINEEEGIRKFFTGHDSKEEKKEAISKFKKALDEAEAEFKKNPKDYSFNRKDLEKKAKEDNYRGGLRIQRGGRSSKMYVVYDQGATGFQKLAGASAGSRNAS